MDAEGKRIWAALCKAGATEEDRAEAADQRAQADEEKAEAERNIAASDRLKEAARIRTALGFKEAVTPSEAIAIQQNRVNTVRRELLEPAMSEEDDDESSDKKAMDRYPPIRVPRGWRPSEEQSSGCEEDYMDEWNSDFFKTCETFIKRVLVPAFKKRRWTVDGADCEHAYDWEEEGAECWIEISGKGGQKIGLAGRKHIVLDRNVSEDVHFNILPAVEDMEFEGSEQFDVDEFADWTWDAECPIDEIESLEFQGASFPPTPSGVDKFMQAVDRYWIRKSGVRSKIKRNALKREGQAIREALGFPKEAGESFYATDNAVELAAQIAREINKRGGRARVVKGPYGPEKNLVMAATIEIPSMGGTSRMFALRSLKAKGRNNHPSMPVSDRGAAMGFLWGRWVQDYPDWGGETPRRSLMVWKKVSNGSCPTDEPHSVSQRKPGGSTWVVSFKPEG